MSTPTTTSTSTPIIRLTTQEKRVLELIARGDTAAQAASALGISKRTVDFHLANIFTKFGVHTRIGAIRRAMEQGLLAMPRSAK